MFRQKSYVNLSTSGRFDSTNEHIQLEGSKRASKTQKLPIILPLFVDRSFLCSFHLCRYYLYRRHVCCPGRHRNYPDQWSCKYQHQHVYCFESTGLQRCTALSHKQIRIPGRMMCYQVRNCWYQMNLLTKYRYFIRYQVFFYKIKTTTYLSYETTFSY